MTSTYSAASRKRSIRNIYSFLWAILLVPLCLGQSTSTSATPAATTLPDAPEMASAARPEASTNATAIAYAPTQVYVFPDREERAHAYVYDLIGPRAFLAPAITAGLNQIHPLKVGYPADGFPGPGLHPAYGTVPEWGEGFGGYSKRYADSFGQGLINTTSRYALGEILREDVTYHRCACSGAGRRAVHALAQAFVAHTRSGRAVPSIPALVSPFAASEIAVTAWYPSRFNSSDTLRISIPQFVGVPVKNLVAEFRKGK
jgi:hypothetical protein